MGGIHKLLSALLKYHMVLRVYYTTGREESTDRYDPESVRKSSPEFGPDQSKSLFQFLA